MKLLIHAILFMILFSSCSTEDTLTEKEVLAVIEQFDQGWKLKDAKLVDSVLSDKYVYFTQSGHTFDRTSLVKTAGSNVYTLQNMERESYTVMLEGNTAVVNTTWQGKGVYHGQNFDDKQRCSITIVKNEGKVKILSEHCTPIRNTPIVN
ncbi:MAG: nuclear transport factor 2 family protein [Chitinophagaceae bacterium]|nr:nuclear transport factor 2 family protein [Chitinophagaceae bacterium]